KPHSDTPAPLMDISRRVPGTQNLLVAAGEEEEIADAAKTAWRCARHCSSLGIANSMGTSKSQAYFCSILFVLLLPCCNKEVASGSQEDGAVESPQTITWSRRLRRIVPMTRSTYARCQGARGAESTSVKPMFFSCF